MADVFNLQAKIGLDKSEYEDGIGEARSSMSGLASAVGTGLKTVAAVGAAAVAAAATGVAALTKMSVEGYAEYEQLAGGVETLFKESQGTVMQYAKDAYKTAGLSANAYMETVTSFSASLIQSLDGDTAKAAEVADMAITDMSDNANKMGTSIEMLQNAYNGFAKGNFTMLDNLKLGYGGTKEEMQRLLEDAEKLSGIEYDISSFADISEAIHVMQEEMGIAGTTAREAATTIEGSIGMMKGAWQNLVVGLADENANIESLTYDLVESILAVSDNLMPRIEQTLAGISQLVEGVAPIIATLLPKMLETLLPSLLTAASSLMTSLCNALPGLVTTLLPPLIEAALSVITTLFNMLPELLATVLPLLITAAFDICMAFLNVVTENGPQFLQTGIDAVVQLVAGISEMLPEIIAAAIALITELVNTLTSEENLNLLIETAFSLIDTIVTGLMDNLPALIAAAIQLVTNLVSYITQPGNLEKLLSMALDLIMTIMNGLVDAIPELVTAATELIVQLVSFLLDPANISTLLGAALDIVLAIVDGLLQASGELLAGAVELITQLCDEFTNTDWAGVASSIIDSLLSGLKTAWTSVSSWFSGVWDSLFNKNVNVSSDGSGGVSVRGYATGLNWVPYDEFPALLHRGEAVLTAAEARAWRNGQGATPAMAGVTINQYIQSVPQTPAEMAATTEAYFEQARWML